MSLTNVDAITERDQIAALRATASRFQEAYILASITVDCASAKTVRGRCRHGEDHVLWREVENVIYENLADRPYIGYSGIARPEEWTRVKDVFITVEDIHPAIAAGRVPSHPAEPCAFCRQTDADYEREPIDFLGESRLRSRR